MGHSSDHWRQLEIGIEQGHGASHLVHHRDGIYPVPGTCAFMAPPLRRDFAGRGSDFGAAKAAYQAWLKASVGNLALICPLCLEAKDFAQFTWEHAPQDAGQSAFGEWKTGCWTCKACNNNASRFEGNACRDQIFRITADQVLIEVKTAYLIAFVALGHWWVTSQGLNSIREAFRHRDPNRCATTAFITQWEPEWRTGPGVVNVRGPEGFIVVYSATGFAVILPSPDNSNPPPTVPRYLSKHQRQPWPMLREVKPDGVRESCGNGHFFHGDFCMKEPHWAPIVARAAA